MDSIIDFISTSIDTVFGLIPMLYGGGAGIIWLSIRILDSHEDIFFDVLKIDLSYDLPDSVKWGSLIGVPIIAMLCSIPQNSTISFWEAIFLIGLGALAGLVAVGIIIFFGFLVVIFIIACHSIYVGLKEYYQYKTQDKNEIEKYNDKLDEEAEYFFGKADDSSVAERERNVFRDKAYDSLNKKKKIPDEGIAFEKLFVGLFLLAFLFHVIFFSED